MLRAYVDDGLTLEEIGKRWNISRERVRQELNKTDATLYRLAMRRRSARRHLNKFVNKGATIITRECFACGQTFSTATALQTYCSSTHQRVAVILRYHTDDSYYETHKLSVAKWVLKNQDRVPAYSFDHAERKLQGTSEDRGRWFVVGSIAFHWALRAYLLGWPIFDKIAPELQKQIKEYAEGENGKS